MAVYRTKFKLLNPVLNLEEAQKYLTEDDMTRYMQYDSRTSDLFSRIDKIEFILKTEKSGKIKLTTNEDLTEQELLRITDWVKGQLSDGLGEGFIQQDFACYEPKDALIYDYNGIEQGFVVADFDFSDDFIFEQVK